MKKTNKIVAIIIFLIIFLATNYYFYNQNKKDIYTGSVEQLSFGISQTSLLASLILPFKKHTK